MAGKTSANILLSPDQTVADSVLTLASSSDRLKLKAGKAASFNLKFPKSIPASLGAGIYHILIQFTDTTGAISTIDSGRSLDVVAPVVDLIGSFVKVPASVKAGEKFVATFQVTNMSDANVAAAGVLPIEIKTSSDSQLADAILLETLKRPINLEPGKSLKITLTLSVGAATDLLVVNVDSAHTAFSDDPEVANEVFSQQIIVV